MVNYSKSIIYKLCCQDPAITKIYIGSTTAFARRKNQHKFHCITEKSKNHNYYVYQFIRDNGNWDNWDMVQVEKYDAKDKYTLHCRERHWIETLKSELNIIVPTRTKKEHYQDNKDAIQELNKEYYQNNKKAIIENVKHYRENNKDKIQELNKQYYQDNKEAILEYQKEYYENNKEVVQERFKQYYQDNKVAMKAQMKQYRVNNKDALQAHANGKIMCECGSTVSRSHLARHTRSKKHKDLIRNK